MPAETIRARPDHGVRLRPDVAGHHPDDEWCPPLKVARLVPPSDRFAANTLSWRRRLAWLLDGPAKIPQPVQTAIDDLEAHYASEFTPNPKLVELGVPSLVAEARSEWSRQQRATEGAKLRAVGAALVQAADDIHGQAAAGMAAAVKSRDDQRWATWLEVARNIRDRLGTLEGVPPGATMPKRLNPASELWVIANPREWHAEGRPRLTAAILADNPEWEPSCYTPQQVLHHLAALGHH